MNDGALGAGQVLGREGVVPFETFFTAGFGYDEETGQVTFPGQPDASQVGASLCPGFLAMALCTRSQRHGTGLSGRQLCGTALPAPDNARRLAWLDASGCFSGLHSDCLGCRGCCVRTGMLCYAMPIHAASGSIAALSWMLATSGPARTVAAGRAVAPALLAPWVTGCFCVCRRRRQTATAPMAAMARGWGRTGRCRTRPTATGTHSTPTRSAWTRRRCCRRSLTTCEESPLRRGADRLGADYYMGAESCRSRSGGFGFNGNTEGLVLFASVRLDWTCRADTAVTLPGP